MKKVMLALVLVSLIPVFIVAGVLLVDWEEAEEEPEEILGNLYTFSLSVGEETYIVTVRSNYSSAPEVSYNAFPSFLAYYVSVDFRGDPEDSFCNITIPTDLIWGEISVISKYYEMSADFYILSNNGTHNSVYFTFNQIALVKHFEIRGTEGISQVPSSTSAELAATSEPQQATDDYVRFYAFTIYSPLNKTYNNRFLTLNLSFTAGLGIKYSLYYLLDGEWVNTIPYLVEGTSELHLTYSASGFTNLPELSEGSHSLTVFLECKGLVEQPPVYSGTVFFAIDSKKP